MRIAILVALYVINAVFAPNPTLSIPLTLPVFLMCVIGLGRTKSAYVTIGDMFWFCILLFFAISPLQRIGVELVGRGQLTTLMYLIEEYMYAFLIIYIFVFPFLFVSMSRPDDRKASSQLRMSNTSLFLLAFSFLLLYTNALGGIDGLLASRNERRALETSSISPLFLAGLSTCCCVLAVKAAQHGARPAWGTVLAASIILTIAANPFNISRFLLLSVWVPFVLCVVNGRVRAIYFYGTATAALLFIFPILSVTTRVGMTGLISISEINYWSNFLYIPFIDVIDTTIHNVRYMESHNFTLGSKMIAIVLFFVPRSVWPDKPIVGGLDVGRDLHYYDRAGTDNLSFFAASDLYMDFWFFGPVIGGILLAVALRAILRSSFGWISGQDLLRYYIIGSLPILLRGPVGAVLALFSCQIMMLVVLAWLQRKSVSAGSVDLVASSAPGPTRGRNDR